jgi:hypothetical protein
VVPLLVRRVAVVLRVVAARFGLRVAARFLAARLAVGRRRVVVLVFWAMSFLISSLVE